VISLNTALLVTRLLLAAVFATASVAKLADRSGSRQAIISFPLPGGGYGQTPGGCTGASGTPSVLLGGVEAMNDTK
jgi:uncharacterized membrane protein YphA (DoxX/SURF4 family)